ncbi:hypothetical protein [Bacteroides sp. 519]|uniref:hypothetical protein n=1 Tax=Bacteroides sp. 519 TaxID=2302937 RepID=UPI0013D85B19|nr:hypothetical protein [Bacteroides sp. 519]
MEHIIRKIIQAMAKEPRVKAVIEDELNNASFLNEVALSEIRIDKECNLYLTNYENCLIGLTEPLPKALYLFYLFSSKGISNKELSAHKDTLRKIYQIVSGKDDYQSGLTINGFLRRKGGIADVTYKINTALREVIPAESLKYYMIRGIKNSVRQILIPKHLVVIEHEGLLRGVSKHFIYPATKKTSF